MSAIEQEMRRRAEQGELPEKLREECQHLALWAKREFQGQQTPKVRSIENVLRHVYKKLQAQKPDIK